MTCSVCGKNLSLEGIEGRVAAVEVTMQTHTDPAIRQFLQRQMGSYKLGTTYRICAECYLRCFGVKEGSA